MLKRTFVLALGLVGMLTTLEAQTSKKAKPLTIGDDAPGLEIFKWLKGTPVEKFEKGNVYVLEFWATWCGPCVAAMPHLSELAREYKGKANFIGVSVLESTRGPAIKPETLQNFVDKKGKDMDYNVAMEDPTTQAMAEKWLRASGQAGIPATFIIDKGGKIAWIGHPSNLDTVLRQIVLAPETYNQEATKAKYTEAMQKQAIMLLGRDVMNYVIKKNYGTALQEARKLSATVPGFERENFWLMVHTYLQYNVDSALAYVREKSKDTAILKLQEKGDDFEAVREDMRETVAKVILQMPGLETHFYYDAIDRLKKTKKEDQSELYWATMAQGYSRLNEPEKAIAAQEKAISGALETQKAHSKNDMMKSMSEIAVNNLKASLEKYKEQKKRKATL